MRIKDICDINKANVDFDGETIVEYLDTGNLTEGVIGSLQQVAYSKAPSRAQRKVQENTILYSTVRPNLKHYGLLKCVKPTMVASTGFITLDVKESRKDEIDVEYLYYLITQPWVTDYLHTIAENSVSAYPSISPNDLGNMDFYIPPFQIQRRIAAILSNIDKKIALNRQINRNLLVRSSTMVTVRCAA